MFSFNASTEQDRGWAWVVLVAATINNFVSLGVTLGSGVYVTEIIHNWGISKANGALVGSLLFGICCSTGPLSTMLVARTSHRTVIVVGGILSSMGFVASASVPNITGFYFTFCVLGGIGCGMVYLQSLILVNLYFKRYRGIASGIVVAGGGGGVLAIPLISRILIDHFSWRPSLYILAGFCLNTCVFGALMRPIRLRTAKEDMATIRVELSTGSENDNNDQRGTQSTENLRLDGEGISLLKNKTYICYAINNVLWGLSCTVPIILGPDLYAETGFVGIQVDILISSFGFGNILGRIVGGVLCNLRHINTLTLYVLLSIFLGGFIALYTTSTSFVLFAIASAGHGLLYGAHIVANIVVVKDIVGGTKMEQAISFAFFASSLGAIAGPPLSGSIYDWTNSYMWPYLIAAILEIFSGILLVPSLIIESGWCATDMRYASDRGQNKNTFDQIGHPSDSQVANDEDDKIMGSFHLE